MYELSAYMLCFGLFCSYHYLDSNGNFCYSDEANFSEKLCLNTEARMYKKFYGLRDRPFSLNPDPGYLYLGRYHQEALACLSSRDKKNSHFLIFTGDIGSGKTSLLRTFVKNLGPEVELAQVVYPPNDRIELLQMILRSLDIKSTEDTLDALRAKIQKHLVRQRGKGKKTLLVIDEAQSLGEDALKETIWFSKLEGDNQYLTRCFARVILVGLPELLKKFSSLPGVDFKGLGVENFSLQNLPDGEVHKYIDLRLATAGCCNFAIFPEEVINEIGRFSGGNPGLINMTCDAALLYGYCANAKIITLPMLKEVLNDQFHEQKAETHSQPELYPDVSISDTAKSNTGEQQLLPEQIQKACSKKSHLKPHDTGIEDSSVKDMRPGQDNTLPLTVLMFEKSARIRVHLEDKLQEQGFNLVVLPRLDDLFKVLSRSTTLELQVLVADAAFFFTEGGREEPFGKRALDRIQAVYPYLPLIITSTLPLTSIRTKLFQRGVPFLLNKPDLNCVDMSEVPIRFNMFFDELKSCLKNIHSQFGAFYQRVAELTYENPDVKRDSCTKSSKTIL